jgi:hypothetical protein
MNGPGRTLGTHGRTAHGGLIALPAPAVTVWLLGTDGRAAPASLSVRTQDRPPARSLQRHAPKVVR